MLAKVFQQLPNGLFRPIADIEIVEETRGRARAADEEYQPDFPQDRTTIEKILRLRPHPKHMNWIPSETLEDLSRENIEHGDPVPENVASQGVEHAI